jgi:hypothetical protein
MKEGEGERGIAKKIRNEKVKSSRGKRLFHAGTLDVAKQDEMMRLSLRARGDAG